jgi:inositol phosphorylceramide mannosyltransferase catalytic subunit
MIPKLIHLTHFGDTLPAVYIPFVDAIKRLHPGWEINIYNDGLCRAIMQANFPDLVPIFDGYKHGVQRSDLFRYIIVYLMGGFYMDCDVQLYKPLDDLLVHRLIVTRESKDAIGNYFFGAIPEEGFLAICIGRTIRQADKKVFVMQDIINTSGPVITTGAYDSLMPTEKGVILETDRLCGACGQPSCQIGEYGAHLHLGSWRWDGNYHHIKYESSLVSCTVTKTS